jgi:catecholate siderophore receptor
MNPRGFAPSIAFGLGTNARAVFAYEHLRRKDLPDWGVPGATIPGLATYFQSNGVAAGAARDAFYGLRSDMDHTTSDSFTARFEYDLAKDVTISNQTRWSNVDRFARYTVPTGLTVATLNATTQTQFYERSNTTLTNLTNLSAKFHTGSFKHSVAMGLEFTSEDSDSNRYGTFNRTRTSVFDPNPDRDGAIFPNATQRAGLKINTIAAYLYDTFELNRYWEISGGLRAERYKVDISSANALTGAPLPPIDGYEDSQTTLGGKIGIVYKPVENGSIYAAYSVTHQPPGGFLSNPDISRTGEKPFRASCRASIRSAPTITKSGSNGISSTRNSRRRLRCSRP